MKKIFFILFVLITQSSNAQQFSNHNILLNIKFDSVLIAQVQTNNRETSSMSDSIEIDEVKILRKRSLKKNEINFLYQQLKQKKSFVKGFPLLYEHNIEIAYYKNGAVIQKLEASNLTKKIVLKREGCKIKTDKTKFEYSPCLFYGKMSVSLETTLKKLLNL